MSLLHLVKAIMFSWSLLIELCSLTVMVFDHRMRQGSRQSHRLARGANLSFHTCVTVKKRGRKYMSFTLAGHRVLITSYLSRADTCGACRASIFPLCEILLMMVNSSGCF
jgi:hypothetical protein